MTKIIILAAGKGSRMAAEVPKVLVSLDNKPMIVRLLNSVVDSKVDDEPIIVVSPENKEIIQEALKDYKVRYVVQEEQLGTGHAVSSAIQALSPEVDRVIVLYGDHPFVTSESIKCFSENNEGAITVMPTIVSDYNDWRYNFYHWGRFIRNEEGNIVRIREFKDASEEEKNILEVNPGFMCFDKEWLIHNINKLKNNNKAQEYYLTDLVGVAFQEGVEIGTVHIDAKEAIGVNSKEELQLAENLL